MFVNVRCIRDTYSSQNGVYCYFSYAPIVSLKEPCSSALLHSQLSSLSSIVHPTSRSRPEVHPSLHHKPIELTAPVRNPAACLAPRAQLLRLGCSKLLRRKYNYKGKPNPSCPLPSQYCSWRHSTQWRWLGRSPEVPASSWGECVAIYRCW